MEKAASDLVFWVLLTGFLVYLALKLIRRNA